MKKNLKYGFLIVLGIIIMLLLTGCGEDKIIANKKDSDNTIGEYSTRMEIIFDKDILSSIKIIMDFEDESLANILASNKSEEGLTYTKEGKSVSVELDAEKYKEYYGEDYSTMSKEEIKAELETEGFTIEEK